MKKTFCVLNEFFSVEFDEYVDGVIPFSVSYKGKSKKYESSVKCDGRYSSVEKYIFEYANINFEKIVKFFDKQ